MVFFREVSMVVEMVPIRQCFRFYFCFGLHGGNVFVTSMVVEMVAFLKVGSVAKKSIPQLAK